MDEANEHPFPQEARFWSKEDVGHFLTTLGLRQYRAAFAEAAVDGDFLLALNPNDCADVLGVEHPLHSKKLFLAIDKLRPLTLKDREKKASGGGGSGGGGGVVLCFVLVCLCLFVIMDVCVFVLFLFCALPALVPRHTHTSKYGIPSPLVSVHSGVILVYNVFTSLFAVLYHVGSSFFLGQSDREQVPRK